MTNWYACWVANTFVDKCRAWGVRGTKKKKETKTIAQLLALLYVYSGTPLNEHPSIGGYGSCKSQGVPMQWILRVSDTVPDGLNGKKFRDLLCVVR